MEPTQEPQAVENQAAVEAEQKPIETISPEAPKKGFIDKAIPWVIVAIVFFIAGAIVVWFTMVQPKNLELQTAQTQLETAAQNLDAEKAKLETANTQITEVQNEIASVQSELSTAQTTIAEKEAEIAKIDQSRVVYKFQADVNAARLALENIDTASSRQALTFVQSDLADLENTGIAPDAIAGFKARIEEALENLDKEPLQSKEAMETLNENLLLLINNL